MGTSFAGLNISRSQNNYNTASHKGLQSYYYLPATNDTPADPTTNGPASAPLPSRTSEALSMTVKAEPRSKPRDDSKQRTAQVDTVKLSVHPVSKPKLSASSLHRSTSQPTPPTTSAPATGSSDNELLSKPQNHLSARAQQDQDQLRPVIRADVISSTAPRATSEPPPLALPASEACSDSAEVEPLVAQENHTVPDQTPDPGIPTTSHRTSLEGTSRPSRVAIDSDGPTFDFKKDPPAAPTDRENMQASEIKAILDSHSIQYHEDFTKSELLYILDQTFPISGASPGWEARLFRAGEKFYCDTVGDTPSWNELRITKSNESGESRSERVLLPQKISASQISPSRLKPLETGKLYSTKLPEGFTAEHVTFNGERVNGW
jgi:hypothetical protein